MRNTSVISGRPSLGRSSECPPQFGNQMVGLAGFGENRRDARPDRAFVHVGGPIGGHRENGYLAEGGQNPEVGCELETVPMWQRDIGDHHIGRAFMAKRDCVLRVARFHDAKPLAFEHLRIPFAGMAVVVHEQYEWFCLHVMHTPSEPTDG